MDDPTRIALLGTIHLGRQASQMYIQELWKIMNQLKPDLICAELSPEQLDGSATIQSKPEFQEVILPFAQEQRIEVAPIQPNTKKGEELETKMKSIIDRIKSDPIDKERWLVWERFEELADYSWSDVFNVQDGLVFVQSQLFNRLHFEPRFKVIEEFFPDFSALWEDWNEYFLVQINKNIEKHIGKNILIAVGLSHKYWLWNRLITRSDIELHDI